MRTTRKEFKAQVQEHIREILCDEYYQEEHFQLQALIDGFNNWYNEYEQKRHPNRWDAMQDWFQGLPSEINIEYRLYEIEQLLVKWFDNMGEHYKLPKDDSKSYNLYYRLVMRELGYMFRQHNINF
jgi:hypothetical protein